MGSSKLHIKCVYHFRQYVDEECDVLPLEVCGLLVGRPWQYDHSVQHAGRTNTYTFIHKGIQRTLISMNDKLILSDMVLTVRKERGPKKYKKLKTVSLQVEGDDFLSVEKVPEALMKPRTASFQEGVDEVITGAETIVSHSKIFQAISCSTQKGRNLGH